MMDPETVQMLQRLPDDLRARAWMWVASDSGALTRLGETWHKAVYVRPFDDGVDKQVYSGAVYDRVTRQHIMRVSTLNDRSASWHDTRRDAIRRMRDIDAKRRRMR